MKLSQKELLDKLIEIADVSELKFSDGYASLYFRIGFTNARVCSQNAFRDRTDRKTLEEVLQYVIDAFVLEQRDLKYVPHWNKHYVEGFEYFTEAIKKAYEQEVK